MEIDVKNKVSTHMSLIKVWLPLCSFLTITALFGGLESVYFFAPLFANNTTGQQYDVKTVSNVKYENRAEL
jgi:hypothetical protein